MPGPHLVQRENRPGILLAEHRPLRCVAAWIELRVVPWAERSVEILVVFGIFRHRHSGWKKMELKTAF